jgi:hypothetical protein
MFGNTTEPGHCRRIRDGRALTGTGKILAVSKLAQIFGFARSLGHLDLLISL